MASAEPRTATRKPSGPRTGRSERASTSLWTSPRPEPARPSNASRKKSWPSLRLIRIAPSLSFEV
uniref:Uncharacterized protein n=1 Tax=uncultured marine virus TaxID=186617 RepID=A0A0F7L8X6_9VIRU|nr:hypothetical protein [uncultured marine virus]